MKRFYAIAKNIKEGEREVTIYGNWVLSRSNEVGNVIGKMIDTIEEAFVTLQKAQKETKDFEDKIKKAKKKIDETGVKDMKKEDMSFEVREIVKDQTWLIGRWEELLKEATAKQKELELQVGRREDYRIAECKGFDVEDEPIIEEWTLEEAKAIKDKGVL